MHPSLQKTSTNLPNLSEQRFSTIPYHATDALSILLLPCPSSLKFTSMQAEAKED
jgi:hypothetical protein